MRSAFYVIIALLLSSCYVLDNPYDPKSANYNESLASSTTSTTIAPGNVSTTTSLVHSTTTTTVTAITSTTSTSTTTSTTTTTTTIASGGPIPNGTYQLDNVGAGFAQQTDSFLGASIYSCTTYTGATDQEWIVTAVGSYYEIASVSNGYVIAAGGASLVTAVYTGADSQLWTITSLGGGKYQLINKSTGQSAHIQNDGTYSGNPMWLDTYSSGDTFFQWTFNSP